MGPGLCALPRSKPLRFRFLGTPQRHRLSWACVLCPSQVPAAQATRCLVSTLSQVCGAFYHLPGPIRLFSWVCSGSAVSGVLCVSSGELISECNPPGRCQPSRIPERLGWQLGETAHNLVENAIPRAETAPRLPALAGMHLPLCLWQGEGLVHSWLALLWYLLNLLFCEQARLCLWAFRGKVLSLSFFFPLSLAIPQFGLLSHVSSLRLSSGHSGQVLTLSNAARTSLFSPRLLVADTSFWAISPLGVAVRHVICGIFCFLPFSSLLCPPLKFQNSP